MVSNEIVQVLNLHVNFCCRIFYFAKVYMSFVTSDDMLHTEGVTLEQNSNLFTL